jgi:hypothetical protein
MARETYVIRNGELIPKRLAARRPRLAPYVRTDGMDPVRSMADGRLYDSRSAYYASVRAAGCEIVGDERGACEHRPEPHDLGVAADIKTAIEQLRSR